MATYFVDGDLGDDGNDGLSSGAPKKTIPTYTTADTVLFKRGATVALAAQHVILADSVTWEDYGEYDALPRIVDAGIASTGALINTNNKNALAFRRLYAERGTTHAGRAALDIRGATVTVGPLVEECELVGGQDGTVRIIDLVPGVTIRSNIIHGGGTDGVWARCGDGTRIVDNTIYDSSAATNNGDGVQLSEFSGRVLVARNSIVMPTNSIKQTIIAQSSVVGAFADIRSNVGQVTGASQVGISLNCAGVVVANTISGLAKRGLQINSSGNDQATDAYGNVVDLDSDVALEYGIICAGVHTGKAILLAHNTLMGRFLMGILLSTGTSGTAQIDANLIDLVSEPTTLGGISNQSGVTVSSADRNNIYRRAAGVDGDGLTLTNTTTVDPQFSDPANGDLRLRTHSPAVGAGVDWWSALSLPVPRDAAGNRYLSPPSIGAYELRTDRPGTRRAGATRLRVRPFGSDAFGARRAA